MRALKHIFIIILLTSPFVSFSQENASKKNKADTAQSKQTYQRKTRKTTTSALDNASSVRKENAPVLNDNGNVNTTGIVDGSRSSTGRPNIDTTASYSVKRTKKTITTGGQAKPDSIKKPKMKP